MIKILVVDDDADFLKVVSTILSHAGYRVETSMDCYDAIDRMGKEVFDLILSDANMPKGSGFDLVKTIRKHYSSRDVVIAMLTARRDKKDVFHGLEIGADDYITKPIDPDLFLTKVDSLLSKRGQQKNRAIKFSTSKVHMVAKWEVTAEITEISEKGVTIKSSFAPAVNSKIRIKSDLYNLVGIETPTLRVAAVSADPKDPLLFIVEASFVGLVEGELQKIRFWINSNIQSLKERKSA